LRIRESEKMSLLDHRLATLLQMKAAFAVRMLINMGTLGQETIVFSQQVKASREPFYGYCRRIGLRLFSVRSVYPKMESPSTLGHANCKDDNAPTARCATMNAQRQTTLTASVVRFTVPLIALGGRRVMLNAILQR
jgi:hypothetical protein